MIREKAAAYDRLQKEEMERGVIEDDEDEDSERKVDEEKRDVKVLEKGVDGLVI